MSIENLPNEVAIYYICIFFHLTPLCCSFDGYLFCFLAESQTVVNLPLTSLESHTPKCTRTTRETPLQHTIPLPKASNISTVISFNTSTLSEQVKQRDWLSFQIITRYVNYSQCARNTFFHAFYMSSSTRTALLHSFFVKLHIQPLCLHGSLRSFSKKYSFFIYNKLCHILNWWMVNIRRSLCSRNPIGTYFRPRMEFRRSCILLRLTHSTALYSALKSEMGWNAKGS